MMAPPPMPNRPARMPVTTPPMTIATASHISSPTGTPNIEGSAWGIARTGDGRSRRGGVLQFGPRVHDQGERLAQDPRVRAGFHTLGRDMAAERARARHALKQAEQVARD